MIELFKIGGTVIEVHWIVVIWFFLIAFTYGKEKL